MIAFASLFLGLVVGIQPVTVLVEGRAAAVRFELDGRAVGRIQAPPWSLPINFGTDLSPHELVASALDERGREIGRARQWLNLPRPPAEVHLVLARDEKGRSTAARLSWESLHSPGPTSVAVTFDGKPLPVKGNERLDLPEYDPDIAHLLTARVEFPNSIRARTDVVVGGHARSEAVSELTAVPVRVRAGSKLPAVQNLNGWFVKKGQPLSPVAVEDGRAEVWIVRDLGIEEAVARLGRGGRTIIDPTRRGALPVYDPDALRLDMRLGDEDRLRFLWPTARRVSSAGTPSELFDSSHEFYGRQGGLHWLLTRVYHPGRVEPHRRFADAVAVAGLQAVSSYSRRAVVLVLGSKVSDASRYAPAIVRGYLKKVNVPLFVWLLEGPGADTAAAPWGEAEDVSSVSKLRSAVERLKSELESQSIVWIEGHHLPQDITLSDQAQGIELVG